MMNDAAYVYERHPYIFIFQLREQAGLISPLSAETTRQGTLCQLGFVCMGMRWREGYGISIHVKLKKDQRPHLDFPKWTCKPRHAFYFESRLFFLALLFILLLHKLVDRIIAFQTLQFDLQPQVVGAIRVGKSFLQADFPLFVEN